MKLFLGVLVIFGVCASQAVADDDLVVVPDAAVQFAPAGFTQGPSNIFPRTQSIYNGLIAPVDELDPERSGYFRITITPYGYYSGYFVVGADRIPLRGFFNSQGQAGVSIYRWVWDDCICFRYLVLAWTVRLDLVPGTDEIEGTVDYERRGGWSAELFGVHSYPYSQPAPEAGRYTLRLPGSLDASIAPPGDGFGAVTVNSRGGVQLTGSLPDGVKLTDSAFISTNGWWPVHVPLNDGQGILFGWLFFAGPNLDEISGALTWIKPPWIGRVHYPNGFDGTINPIGGPYLPPAISGTPLGWTSGEFVISGGNLDGPSANAIRFESSSRIVDEGGDLVGLKIRVKPRSGLFSGSFTYPGTARKTAFSGAFFQLESIGGGYFLGIDQGGLVRLQTGE